MEKQLLTHIDTLIKTYREEHKGEAPLYIVLSPEENKAVREAIRKKEGASDDLVIASYKNIKLAENPGLLNGNIYVSNDLPETGS